MSETDSEGPAPFDAHCTASVPSASHGVARPRPLGPVVALRVKGSETEIPIPNTAHRISIGSRGGCDVTLPDPYVSGLHCMLERRGETWFVRDRSSKNGTSINGQTIEGAELRPGSVLVLGRTTLIAVAEGGRGRRSAHEQLRGSDPRFVAHVQTALRAATTECSVLVVGETGTGKDLLARAIHEASPRANGPFIAVNCGGIPRELIGSELFGHERGAFTGALTERDGYFAMAHGGTLFLDELGELPLEQQPHLLRALETRRVRRIGGADEQAVDTRIIAATNRLDGLGSARSTIRLDLYHRVATVVVTMPPLRDRPADIDELVGHVLDDLAPQHGRRTLSASAWDAVRAYHWPGNVRELRQVVTRAVTLGERQLELADLFPDSVPILEPGPTARRALRAHGTPSPGPQLAPLRAGSPSRAHDGVALPPYEAALRELMIDALARCRSLRAAAQALGMPKSTFAEKAARWGLLDDRRDEP
jgi:DNA-binding NtrC family response regulator